MNRRVGEVASRLAEIVPERHKDVFLEICEDSVYTAPELENPYWVCLSRAINDIVPNKLNKEWQIKAVAILTDKDENFVRENYYDPAK